MRTAGLLLAAALMISPAAAYAHDCGKAGSVDLVDKTFTGDTHWSDGDTFPMTIAFKADCTLLFGTEGEVYDNARWVQDGDTFSFQLNDGFALYLGTISGQALLKGRMANQQKASGEFSFTLDK